MNQSVDKSQLLKGEARVLVIGASQHPGDDDSEIRVPDGYYVFSYSDEYSLADLLSIKSRDYCVTLYVKNGLNSLSFAGTVHFNSYDDYADFIINRWPAHGRVA